VINKIVGVFVGVVLLINGCASLPKQLPIPDIRIQVSQDKIEPGHAVHIQVVSDSALDMKMQFCDKNVALQEQAKSGNYHAYIAIPLETVPDAYVLTVTASKDNSKRASETMLLMVVKRSPFKTARLWINNFTKYDFASESAIMSTFREQAQHILDNRNLIPFIWPLQGRISEIFGVKRIYNNGEKMWYHGGLDIAAPGGTAIKATASGVVLLTREFEAHGNTTMIHHGFGIVSTYLHQRKIMVQEGQVIQQGDVIGEVGTTGSSTGNHLHFQINVNGEKADPMDFLNSASKLYDKLEL
jgi:peptidase M23-like protein